MCLAGLLPVLLSSPVWGQSITVTEPNGVGDRIAEGQDFAVYTLANRWDMSDAQDVITYESYNIINEVLPSASGTYHATAETDDPGFWIHWPGLPGSIRLERGEFFPIDPTRYTQLTMRVKYTGPGVDFLQLVYFQDWPPVPGEFSTTGFYPLQSGEWVILSIDLETAAMQGQSALWPNLPEVKGLRIDPGVNQGSQFEFDWVRLSGSATNEVPSEFQVRWSSSGLGGSTIALDLVDEFGTEFELVSGLPSGTTSYMADLSAFPPADYSIRVRASNGTSGMSPGQVTINESPVATLIQPDRAGDEDNDYALVEVGNRWGPFEPADVTQFRNTIGQNFEGGSVNGYATTWDSSVTLNTPTFIDTNRYRMLSLDYELEGDYDLGEGAVFRIFWGANSMSPWTSEDVVIHEGRHKYFVGDMRDVLVEEDFTVDRWQGAVNFFRFDPHEYSTELEDRQFHLYNLRLAPLDTANPSYTFEWSAADADDNATIAIYLDEDAEPNSGNEITVATGLPENGPTSLTWNSAGVDPGEYLVYTVIDDGLNETIKYASGPLLVGSTTTTEIDVTQPPAGNARLPAGGDFATDVLADAWDFNESTDLIGMLSDNIGSLQVNQATGKLSGTSVTNDPQFWLMHPDYFVAGSTNNGRVHPIDPGEYRYLVAKMRVTAPSAQFFQVVFLNERGEFTPGDFGLSEVEVVEAGSWQIAIIDLWATGTSTEQWLGFSEITGLRIDPVTSAGVSFEYDWIRLVPNNDPQSTQYTTFWEADTLQADTLDLFVVDPDGAAMQMADNIAASAGSAVLDLGLLAPDRWSVRAVASSGPMADSAGTINVNAPPTLTFLQPDSSGDSRGDFATTQLGNPWGVFDPNDVVAAQGIGGLTYSGGEVHGTLLGPNPNVKLNVGSGIDASAYRMLSITFSLSSPDDSGSRLQVFWNTGNAGGEELLVDQGLQTYVLGDISDSSLFTFPEAWTGLVNRFRVDPHLSGLSKDFTLAEVRLQRYDTMAGRFTIEWVISDPDDNALVKIYSDLDQVPGNGNETLIGQVQESAGDQLIWTADSAPGPGTYYIYAEVSDGLNENTYYAGGPIEVLPDMLFGDGGFED